MHLGKDFACQSLKTSAENLKNTFLLVSPLLRRMQLKETLNILQ
jgi:hypothetical protein